MKKRNNVRFSRYASLSNLAACPPIQKELSRKHVSVYIPGDHINGEGAVTEVHLTPSALAKYRKILEGITPDCAVHGFNSDIHISNFKL
jgi:hypothetical protein